MQGSQSQDREVALPNGSLILITGVNGYIASHIADQLLGLGYRVRGTAREQSKLDMIGGILLSRHPGASFQGVVVPDFAAEGVLDDIVAGCAGILHVATDVSFSPDPNAVIPAVVKGLRNILSAAAKTETAKRFVYTSSSIAAVRPTPNKRFTVDSGSWNEEDVRDAWAPPPYEASRAFSVYGASKVEAEKAGWEFMKTGTPGFVFNAVLPNLAVGPLLNSKQPGSTAGWVRGLYEGNKEKTEIMLTFPPQYNVDVRDVARVHIAALFEKDVQNERLFAFAEPYNYSRVVKILEEIGGGQKEYPPPPKDEGEDLSLVDSERAVELLKRMGRNGFIGLEESLREQLIG